MFPARLIAAAPSFEDITPALVLLLIVIVALVLLASGVRVVFKRFKKVEPPVAGGFTLTELRQFVKEGKMTPEEHERAKATVLAATKRATDVKPARETTSTKAWKTEDQK